MRLVLIVVACVAASGCVNDGLSADAVRNADEQSLFGNDRLAAGAQVETARSVIGRGEPQAIEGFQSRSTP